ncbi:DUF3100 domain-containing protein [Natranaerobius trueperi]|uniref:DUF3100 domain-containing protein n=1 Tax=Natranaerobius trueperi TaxID=759412 RepID=A0A226C176_9FIRM|nr:hypothetical protein CDO51_04925 [Natranaerobius trueperi]
MFNWKLHGIVLVLTIVAELIGLYSFSLGPGTVLLLPMLYALVIGIFMGPRFLKIANKKDMNDASPLITLSVLILMARLGANVGPDIPLILEAGMPLLLQELGNLGTLAIGMPVAVLLGFKREAIGATFSQAREASLAIIGDNYGLDGAEGRGVLGIYIFGTVVGAIWNGLMGGLVSSLGIFHPYALGMASGIGSASMMSAASGSVAAAIPERADEILSFAATSNILTSATGIYVMIFISIPLAERYYKVLTKWKGNREKFDSDSHQTKT